MPARLGAAPVTVEGRQAANQKQSDYSRAVVPAFGHDQPPGRAEFIKVTPGIGQFGLRRVRVPAEGGVIAGLGNRQPTRIPYAYRRLLWAGNFLWTRSVARRSTPKPPPERPAHTVGQKHAFVSRLERRIADLEAFDPTTVTCRFSDPAVKALETAIDEALSAAFGYNTVEYSRYSRAAQLDHGPVSMRIDPILGGRRYHDDTREAQEYVAKGKSEALGLLRQAVKSLTEEIQDEEAQSTPSDVPAPPSLSRDTSAVFLVHGHDEGAREAVARFLEGLGLRPVILHEQTNQGRTIMEKIEAHSEVGFAVVLLTPDDVGCAKGGTPVPRARQNVLLELGYFLGHLKRQRVCALKRGEVDIPSDFAGVVYQTFDDGGGWKTALGRELQAAGYIIDWNQVMR